VDGGNPVFTIGHSNHDAEQFVHLLRDAGIEVVADVRSQPFSRFNPHFNQGALQAALRAAEIRYAFLGDTLGGRPVEPDLYDAAGHVRYDVVAQSERFQAGVERLVEASTAARVAVMCSEEDPSRCHRRLLITPALAAREIAVVHLRGDGTAVTEAEIAAGESHQAALFDD
jgi:uncharacterized protein (DUF488 family)